MLVMRDSHTANAYADDDADVPGSKVHAARRPRLLALEGPHERHGLLLQLGLDADRLGGQDAGANARADAGVRVDHVHGRVGHVCDLIHTFRVAPCPNQSDIHPFLDANLRQLVLGALHLVHAQRSPHVGSTGAGRRWRRCRRDCSRLITQANAEYCGHLGRLHLELPAQRQGELLHGFSQ